MDRVIGRRLFTDGLERDVYEDAEDRQDVLGPDGEGDAGEVPRGSRRRPPGVSGQGLHFAPLHPRRMIPPSAQLLVGSAST
jgi:hypothetical protein